MAFLFQLHLDGCKVPDSYGRECLWLSGEDQLVGTVIFPLLKVRMQWGQGDVEGQQRTTGGFRRRERNLETRKARWEGARRGGAGTARGGRGRQLLCWVCSVLLTLLFWQVQGWPENPPPFSSPLQCEEHTPSKTNLPVPNMLQQHLAR